MEPEKAGNKLAHLDGLRGLAALVVVFHHLACAFLPAAIFGGAMVAHFSLERTVYSSPLQLLIAGNFAVCIFFVLSGYVLSHRFFITKDFKQVQIGAAKRYFRLMPPVLVSVLLGYIIIKLRLPQTAAGVHFSGSPWLAGLWPSSPGLIEAVIHGTYGVIIGNANSALFDNPLWTMKLEFLGSLLVFAFLALIGNNRQRWLGYVALAVVFRNSYYLAFVIGIAISDLNVNRPGIQFSRLSTVLMAGLGLLLGAAPIESATPTIYTHLHAFFPASENIFILTHIVGATFVLLAVVHSHTLKAALSNRPMRYLGKISFAMYLLHVLVIGTLTAGVFAYLAHTTTYINALAGSVLASIPVVWLASHLFTRYIDGPTVKLAGRLGHKWFNAKT